MSALDANKTDSDSQGTPSQEKPEEKTAAVEKVKKDDSPKTPAPPQSSVEPTSKPQPKAEPAKKESANTNAKGDNRQPQQPAIPPTTQIDPLKIDKAEEPLVQDLVKIVNDIITAINADNSSNKFSLPITKAKEELAKVGQRIMDLKASEQAAAEEKIKEAHSTFDKSAKELMRRIEETRLEEATHYREEFEAEREKISQSFAEKMRTESDRAQQVSEQRLRNELLEQAIEMKRKFTSDIHSLVEQERSGRLSKINELTSNVTDLEKLTSDWNGVIDSNLKTQQLQVAVDAVRSTLARSDIPRPFVRELAALKDLASDDEVVSAAIASINPIAYQRGVPTSAQLVDRFRRVASEVRKASLLPEDAGIASHASSWLLSKILFKKQGLAQGDDVESILTRTETLLEEGNIEDAAREMNTLQGWAKVLSKDWIGEVRRVCEVRQALDVSTFPICRRAVRLWVRLLTKLICIGHRDRSTITMPSC